MTIELIHNWKLLAKCTYQHDGKKCRINGFRKHSLCLDYGTGGDTKLRINRTAFTNLLISGEITILEAPCV